MIQLTASTPSPVGSISTGELAPIRPIVLGIVLRLTD